MNVIKTIRRLLPTVIGMNKCSSKRQNVRIGIMFRPNYYSLKFDLDKTIEYLVKEKKFNLVRYLENVYALFCDKKESIYLKILNDGTITVYEELYNNTTLNKDSIKLLNKGIEIIMHLKLKHIIPSEDYCFSVVAYGKDILPFYSNISNLAEYLGSIEYGRFETKCLEKSSSFVRISINPKIQLYPINNK